MKSKDLVVADVKEEEVKEIVKTTPKHSLLTNPHSKHYNKKIAKRRAKEKNRKKVNKVNR